MPEEDREYGKSWTKRFALFDECVKEDKWYLDTKATRELSAGERFSTGFNILAFLFSVLYYYIKGMWAKASLLLTMVFLSSTILSLLGVFGTFPVVDVVYGFITPAFCAGFANLDYYHKEKRGERMWPIFPSMFGSVWFAVIGPIASGVLYWRAFELTM